MKPARNRIGSVLAVTALLALTGCSGDDKTPDTASTPSGSSSATDSPTSTPTTPAPTVTNGPDGRYETCDARTTPFTGAAADTFGADKVMNAYCTYAQISVEQTFLDNLMRSAPEDLTYADFQFWEQYMTADALASWKASVKKSLTNDSASEEADASVLALTYYDVFPGSEYSFTEDVAVRNRKFSLAKIAVDTAQSEARLALTFTVSGDFNVVKDGTDEAYLYPTSKDITYYLVPTEDPDRLWLIDGWLAKFHVGEPHLHPTP